MTEVYQISRRQVFRSARSYLRYRGHRLAGSIEELATKRGNRYYLYRPASIDNDAGPDRLIIHLHGAKESWD